ncbi:hypothetical protein MB901379_03797 [Mycobacterium basiliense]|uniref:MarR family protein n=1 Tax=Mycobacterium basiliense TaxID=2094119 RepID=A0A3S4BI51_9MYCO|nr:MarR family transcriptional regulator [Mycobacterium basiliense]VDM90201.1 hypothetical protein MB901379_03797 [Mycobacterium basiliense]
MSELAVLQAVRLKGQVTAANLATTLGLSPADVADTVERLSAAGLLIKNTTLRISSSGRLRLDALLTEERDGVDSAALAAVHDDFRAVNTDFKTLVTDWQLRNGRPNAHDDAEYDAAILARLQAVHQRVTPIIAAAALQVPRLSGYARKLSHALDRLNAGETAWLTRPLMDSYHTVWFELHEELLLAAGLTREQEARAGEAH